MTANVPRLSASTVPPHALIHGPTPPETGIVHLGLGNFHRAHLSVYTARAMALRGGSWGIAAHSRDADLPRLLGEQDLLYSVIDIGPGVDTVVVPAVHTAAMSGVADAGRLVDAIAAEGTRIVSLTVTEAGYCISQRTGDLDVGDPAVRADLDGANPPTTAIGQLVRGLARRAAGHRAPVTVLSCDNVSGNGDLASRAVRQFVAALPADERADLESYVDGSVTFPNSMVDRIVPRAAADHLAMAAQRLGVVDLAPVPAEPFTMWVLEDDFAAGRPAWDEVGAIFTDDVQAYELLKLRLLNGTHSLIAYLGALSGATTIPASRLTPSIESAARQLIRNEYLPTIAVPAGLDVDAYIEQLFDRWSNTVLGDRASRVGTDGSIRLPQRITEPARHHLEQGRMPEFICLTVAGFLACLAPLAGRDPGPEAGLMTDPSAPRLRELAGEASTSHELVHAVFERTDIFSPMLATLPGFVDRIGDYIDLLASAGVDAAVAEATRAYAGGGAQQPRP